MVDDPEFETLEPSAAAYRIPGKRDRGCEIDDRF